MSDEQITPDATQGAGHTDPPAETPKPPTVEALRDRANALGIKGRSSMNREELVSAIAEAEAAQDPRTAFVGVMGALFHDADSQRPSTPEETGRPPLRQIAEERAAKRADRLAARHARHA